MEKEWFVAKSGVRLGPFSSEEVKGLLIQGEISNSTKVWKKGLVDWEDLSVHFSKADIPPPININNIASENQNLKKVKPENKLAAGLCGIFLGAFGIHKFVLGFSTPGLIMLLTTMLTCGVGALVMGTIGLIEGIIYLAKSDEDFIQNYIIDKKQWF